MLENPTHPITIGLILLSLGGIALALVLNRGLHARRELSRRARVAMAQATPGTRVKLVGEIVPDGELARAPLTGRPCVAWRVVISKSTFARGGIFSDLTASSGFYLRDATGTVFVEGWPPEGPPSVWFVARPSHRLAQRESVKSLSPAVLDYLGRYCAKTTAMYLGDVRSGKPVSAIEGTTLEPAEYTIAPGDTVAVVGELRAPDAPGQPPVLGGEKRAVSAESKHLS